MLQRYSIACSGFDYFDDNGLSKCFNTEHARELISTSIFKDLIGRAEVLEFWETGETKWKSLVDRGMMNDLIMLYLCDLADIRCLIDIDMPPGSFGQLQILKLWNCKKLQHLCFDGNLKLPNLKSLHLENCPMLQPSIFQPSIALCVEQLEELIIEDCKELKSLITYESLEEEIVGVDQQMSYVASFQKLKSLQILRCGKLELVSPLFLAGDLSLLEDLCIRDCEEMKYIFGKYEGQALHHDIILPSLTKILLEEVPNFIDIFRECKICTQRSCLISKDDSKEKHAVSFSRAYGCCFLPTTKDNDIEVSSSSLQNVEETKESCALAKKIETFHTIECLMRQPWSLRNIRDMKLYNCSKLKSLFSVSIATTITLEKLEINLCEELKHIITNEVEDDEHLNRTSIFPKLQMLQVIACNKLEFIFPSTLSEGLQKLQHIEIKIAQRLKYVFGEYNNHHQNINVVPIDLPALKILSLEDVPEIISLCANKYYVVWPSLQHITWSHCWGEIKRTLYFMASHEGRQLKLKNGKGLIIRSLFPYFMFCSQPRQLNIKTSKDYMKVIMGLQNLIILEVGHSETIEEIFNVEGIQSGGPMTLGLQEIKLEDLGKLRHIYKDPNNILSLLNLKVLKIDGCDKLRALFTTSTMKSLPRLSYLEVMNCKELVHLIEDDDYETSAYGRSHQLNFPMLETIHIHRCYGLRSLFSISTSTMLPNLKTLKIEVASSLEEVFRCQQDDTQEMFIQNVFPNLSKLKLIILPELRTICQGIDFHSVPEFEVFFCPKYRENGSTTKGLQATHSKANQAMLDMGEAKLEQEIETQELATNASPNLTENSKHAVKDIIEEIPTSKSAMELEHVHIMQESTMQLQQWRLGETKTTNNAPHKTNTPLDDDSINAMLKERIQEEYPIFEDVVVATLLADLAPKNAPSVAESFQEDSAIMKTTIGTTSNYSQAKGLQSNTSKLIYKETNKENGKVVSASNSPATTSHDFEIAIMKEAVEQSFQEHNGSKEAITPTNSNKGFHHSSETRKEAIGMLLTSRLSMVTTSNLKSIIGSIPEDSTTMKEKISTPSIYSQAEGLKLDPPTQVTPSIEGTWEQGPQQNYAIEEDIIANKSINLDLKKQSRLVGLLEKENAQSTNGASKDISESVSASGTSSESILFDSEFTLKETRNASILEGCNTEKATKANLSTESQSYSPNPIKDSMALADVIPPPHHQPQIGVASSLSPTLEIGKIFQLVELKEGEPALLANALERYPQLRLPQEQRTNRIIALSYQVLVDILVMLATKTPCTITASDRLILEDNLGEATILGFDNEWIESVRAKLSGSYTLDVVAAKKEMIDMEAKMETCEIALEDVHKQRAKAKEWLEAIDSQLLGLLEDRKKLVLRIGEIRELMSSKDKPFGF